MFLIKTNGEYKLIAALDALSLSLMSLQSWCERTLIFLSLYRLRPPTQAIRLQAALKFTAWRTKVGTYSGLHKGVQSLSYWM